MKKNNWEKLTDKMDAEIMDWFYEVVKINFGVTMIQDSTELREILKENLLVQRKDFLKDLEGLKMKEEKPYYKWGIGAKFKKIVYKQAVKEINQKIKELKEKYEHSKNTTSI